MWATSEKVNVFDLGVDASQLSLSPELIFMNPNRSHHIQSPTHKELEC